MASLFQSHLVLAHHYWEQCLLPGDIAIDATCGNGHDTLRLARLGVGKLYACDVQQEALTATQELLATKLTGEELQRIVYVHGSHASFPEEIIPGSVKLIVYNLGYLPGGDKQLTTQVATTLASIRHAQRLLTAEGVISITCYPGHAEGALEEDALLAFAAALPLAEWVCCHHRWLNRNRGPSLLLLQSKVRV